MPVRLFVGNLPYDVTDTELRDLFASVGPLYSVFIPVDKETGKRRGFAFIEFDTKQQADQAMQQFNQQSFRGRTLAINEARPKEARPMGSGPPRPYAPRPPMGGPRPPMGPRPSGGSGFAPSASEPFSDPKRDTPQRRFGPDAKPSRGRSFSKPPKIEGAKKPLKERLSGRIYGPDDEDDLGRDDPNFDNFATAEPDENE